MAVVVRGGSVLISVCGGSDVDLVLGLMGEVCTCACVGVCECVCGGEGGRMRYIIPPPSLEKQRGRPRNRFASHLDSSGDFNGCHISPGPIMLHPAVTTQREG